MKAPKTMRYLITVFYRNLKPLGFLITLVFFLNMWSVSAQSISALEYYFDTDPGVGSGTQISANTNTGNLTQNLSIPTTGLDQGFHRLSIRTKDHNNTWGLFDVVTFYISEPLTGSSTISKLTAAEYWIDSDPGPGSGTALAISGNPESLTESFAIPLGTLDKGFHQIGFRVKNLEGTWSLYDRVTFYVSEEISGSDTVSNLAAAEYWFDTDPGPGNGTTLAITGNPDELTENFTIPLGSLENGYHQLGLRTQNLDGTWSLYDRKTFYVIDNEIFETDPVSPLTGAEFLYDSAFGFGTGDAIAITPTENPDEYTLAIPTADVTCDIHDVWITVKNELGNYGLYRLADEIDIYDNLPPTIVVYSDITVELDASGQGSLTVADVNNGTYDDCELVSVVLNQEQFDYTCTNLGTNTVTVTAIDAEDKVSTLDVTVTVVDNINPVAQTQNITVQLDATGHASITPAQIENGSTDNCTVAEYLLDTSSFTCANLGSNTVNLTVKDQSGNSHSAPATVTVLDTVKPTVITQNISVQLDASGNATITPSMVDNSSTDNCSISSYSLDISSFDCSNLGDNTVVLTVTDQSNNVDTETAVVTVEDKIKPTVLTQDFTVYLDASGEASITTTNIDNGSTDNCSISSMSLDISSFTCANLGVNTVNLSVTDQSNNTESASATVTVLDNIAPKAITQNINVQLDASGNATITPSMVDNSSTDNCSISSYSLDISSFDCNNLGDNTVVLTVTDQSNNVDTETAIVTVKDQVKPTVITQDITIYLDASGNASITTTNIDNGSTDNCSISSMSLDISSFTCANLGVNTVSLSVTDQSNNTESASATVTVLDNIAPKAITQNINVQLDASGNATITPSMVDNSSTDNCSISSYSLDISSFDCNNLGDNTVVLTVTDQSNNVDTETAIVTVKDQVKPTVITQDITIYLDASGNASITTTDIDNGSRDNCSISSMSLDISSFDCNDLGDNTVILTVTDQSNNVDTETAIVTVKDQIKPTVITQDITIYLDASGNASITTTDIDNGSSDNCSVSNYNLSKTMFNCDDLGVNQVTLSVTDSSNNIGTNTATVTVVDNINPVAIGQNINLDLNGNTSITISPSDVNNGSSDNCAINLSIDMDTFTSLGVYPVTLTVTDSSNNTNATTISVIISDSSLGIDDFEISEQDIILYPIPTDNNLNISTKLNIDAVSIFDLNGKLVNKIKGPKTIINVNKLQAGIYFLRFDINNKMIQKRIIKN